MILDLPSHPMYLIEDRDKDSDSVAAKSGLDAGLTSMTERVRLINDEMLLQSSPGNLPEKLSPCLPFLP